jgi:hypothetical protein
LEFNYVTLELREICENRRKAVAALGAPAAHVLKQCLADLAALPTAADLAILFEGQMTVRSSSERLINLGSGRHLVFCAGNLKDPRTESGETDWSKVSRIRILGVEVTNE